MNSENQSELDRRLVLNFLDTRREEDFRLIYRRHAPRLNNLIARIVGTTNGDVNDIIQTTWIRVIEKLPTFRFESLLHTWLTGIALNCSREYIRKIVKWSGTDRINATTEKKQASITRTIRRIDLERAIASLPNGYREVLVLHDVQGYTHEEIAQFLGIESGTSKSQLSRARNAMRVKLSEKKGQENEDRTF